MCDQSKHVETLLNNSTMRLLVVNRILVYNFIVPKDIYRLLSGAPA